MPASSVPSDMSSRDAIQTFYDNHSTNPQVPHHVRRAIRNLLAGTFSSRTSLPSKASAYQMAYTAIFPGRVAAAHQATGTWFSTQISTARKSSNKGSEAENELQGLVTAMEDSIAEALVSRYMTGHQCMAEFTECPASDITIQDLCTGPLWDHEQNDLLKRYLCELITVIESTKPVDSIELEDADTLGRAYLRIHTHTSPRSEPHWATVISGTPLYARLGEAKKLMRSDATVHTGRRKLAALLSDVSGIICERLSASYGTGLQAESTATEAEIAMTVAVEEIDLRDANNLRKRCRDAIEG